MEYDIVVVGAGIFGSSIAKYLAESQTSQTIALVGPKEFKDKTSSDILGAHYDEGRAAHYNDPDMYVSIMSFRSVKRYRDLENQTGICFFREIPVVIATNIEEENRNTIENAKKLGSNINIMKTNQLSEIFPYMNFTAGVTGTSTDKHSGYLSPRKYIDAQKKAAEMAGCVIIDDIVSSVKPNAQFGYVITTSRGRSLRAGKVLLATGAFTGSRDLLPPHIKPKLGYFCEMVILVEVKEPYLSQLSAMPPFGLHHKTGTSGTFYNVYVFPPILYPDGKYYLKMGPMGTAITKPVYTKEDIHHWYAKGSNEALQKYLLEAVKHVFPTLPLLQYKWDRCVITFTVSGLPYIDMVAPSLGVAIGGCGRGVMISDEVGKMASSMILAGKWVHDLPSEKFKFIAQSPKRASKL